MMVARIALDAVLRGKRAQDAGPAPVGLRSRCSTHGRSLPSALPLTREGHSVDFGSLGALIYSGFPTFVDGRTDLFGAAILCR
jgi:hypothetical protein